MAGNHARELFAMIIGLTSLVAWACAGETPEVARPTAVTSATPFAQLPPATIVAKAAPPTPLPAFTPPPTPTPEAERVTYRIASGDNPSSIAARYGITSAELLKANNITDTSLLQIGQTLVIPGVTPTPGASVAQVGTATPGATATGTPRPGASVTPTSTPAAGPEPPQGGGTYIVKSGDTASGIASSFGITLAQLAQLNNTSASAIGALQINQQLNVPANGPSSPASTATPSASSTPPAVQGGSTYTVASGDNASSIASRFGISVAQLATLNSTTSAALGALSIGQQLVVPATPVTPTPTPTPTASTEGGAAPGGGSYVVKAGDTLIDIASAHGITVAQLTSANGIPSTATLQIGQRLTIPTP